MVENLVVIDGPIMSTDIFRTFAGILSKPVDFYTFRLSNSEITSTVLISEN
jgi:hypothetical protein